MRRAGTVLLALAVWLAAALPVRAETPVLRVAVLKFGTVNWLMETIEAEGLDASNGFELEVVPLAAGSATAVAFLSGDVDVMVDDWLWAMRQRGEGRPVRFAPYSTALGALMSRGDAGGLCGLEGRRIGVVGGETDKSWIVLQALAARRCGFDLAEATETLFGAPPLMSRQLETGAVDAVSTYWPFAARLEAAGMTRVIGIGEALAALGIDPAPALVGFVWEEGRTDAGTVAAFLEAARAAGAVLADDDAAWERLRPLMRVETDAEFERLRAVYRSGIPEPWTPADTAAAERLVALLREQGGAAFRAGAFDPAVFGPAGADGG